MITELGETQMQSRIDRFAAAYDDASLAVSGLNRLRLGPDGTPQPG